mmetsp:Transcript_36301/g.90659  ORF Transcript_36301/g.90659 Transcript_36301/m.90659 type:complete len:81 (+) Transcript_36301:205-447(+)
MLCTGEHVCVYMGLWLGRWLSAKSPLRPTCVYLCGRHIREGQKRDESESKSAGQETQITEFPPSFPPSMNTHSRAAVSAD